MVLTELFNKFLSHCQRKGLSENSCRAYITDLNDFDNWIGRNGNSDLPDKSIITAWITDLWNRKLAPTTIKRRLTCLKLTFSWLEEEELIEINPFNSIKSRIKLPRNLPRDIKKSELKALLKQTELEASQSNKITNSTIWLGLEIMFATGIRVGELCKIQLNDLNIEEGKIMVHGKGNRERPVFLEDFPLISG